MTLSKYLSYASAMLLMSCSHPIQDSHVESDISVLQDEAQKETPKQEEPKEKEANTYKIPNDCFVNPFINCQGASLGNFLNAYYLVGDFDAFYAFVNNSSKKKYGYDKIESWFNAITFGYEINAINIVDRSDNFGVLVYQTTVNNTRGRLMLPYLIENDSAKLYLTNINVGIEEQFYKGLPNDIGEFFTVAKKLGDIENITTLAQSNTVVLNFGDIFFFDSGEHQLNIQGKGMLEKVIRELSLLKGNDLKIECIGYADPDSFRETEGKDIRNNLDLSVMRASTVAQYLIKSGVVKDKNCVASGVGAAKERSLEKAKETKRRVEIILSY